MGLHQRFGGLHFGRSRLPRWAALQAPRHHRIDLLDPKRWGVSPDHNVTTIV